MKKLKELYQQSLQELCHTKTVVLCGLLAALAIVLSMVASIQLGPYIKIGFSEPRSDGGSNAKIANILEYGKSGQPPKPFLKPAKSAAKVECIRVMEQTLKEEVEKL